MYNQQKVGISKMYEDLCKSVKKENGISLFPLL